MKLATLSMNHLQVYNSIVEVAAGIFGKKDGDRPTPTKINDLSPEAAVATINNVLGMAGQN
jgi:hypothetical protein